MRRKENYPMRKLDVPKRVTLPNGRTFVARYERSKQGDLPADILMKRKQNKEQRQEVGDVGDNAVSKGKELYQLQKK